MESIRQTRDRIRSRIFAANWDAIYERLDAVIPVGFSRYRLGPVINRSGVTPSAGSRKMLPGKVEVGLKCKIPAGASDEEIDAAIGDLVSSFVDYRTTKATEALDLPKAPPLGDRAIIERFPLEMDVWVDEESAFLKGYERYEFMVIDDVDALAKELNASGFALAKVI